MKRFISILLFGALSALPQPPAYLWWLEGCMELDGEALYWKETTGGYEWVQEGTTTETLSPNYHWGFRVGLGYLTEQQWDFIRLTGLYLETFDKVRTQGVDLEGPFGGIFSQVNASLQHEYWNIELLSGHTFFRATRPSINVYGGIRYAEIVEMQKVKGVDPMGISNYKQRLEFWGIGLLFGFGTDLCVWRDLGFSGRFGALALLGNHRSSLESRDPMMFVDQRFPSSSPVVPALDLRFSFDYTLNFPYISWRIALGYELHHYFNAFKQVPPFSLTTPRTLRDVGFGGGSLSLMAIF